MAGLVLVGVVRQVRAKPLEPLCEQPVWRCRPPCCQAIDADEFEAVQDNDDGKPITGRGVVQDRSKFAKAGGANVKRSAPCRRPVDEIRDWKFPSTLDSDRLRAGQAK